MVNCVSPGKNAPLGSGFILFNQALFNMVLYIPINNFSVILGLVFLGSTSTKQGLMSCSRIQGSDASKA